MEGLKFIVDLQLCNAIISDLWKMVSLTLYAPTCVIRVLYLLILVLVIV